MNARSTKMEYEWALMCSERNTPADAAQIKKSSYEYSCPAHFAAHLRSSSLKRNFQNGKPSRRNARFWPDWSQSAFSRTCRSERGRGEQSVRRSRTKQERNTSNCEDRTEQWRSSVRKSQLNPKSCPPVAATRITKLKGKSHESDRPKVCAWQLHH